MEPWSALRRLESEYERWRALMMKRYRLSAIEADVLLFLANYPDYDTAAQIAALRGISKSHVSLAVASLCKRGYLSRRADPGNRRRLHLAISPAASEAVSYGMTQQQLFCERLFDGFSEAERELSFRSLRRVADNCAESNGKDPQ